MDRISVRALITFGLLGLLVPLLLGRLIQLQVLEVGANRDRVALQKVRNEVLPAAGGTIVDRHDRPLAYDRPVMEVQAEAYVTLDQETIEQREDRFAKFTDDLVADLAYALEADPAGAGLAGRDIRSWLRNRIKTPAELSGRARVDLVLSDAVESAEVFARLLKIDRDRDYLTLHYLRGFARTYPDREFTLGSVGFMGWREDKKGRRHRVWRGLEVFDGLRAGSSGLVQQWQDAKTVRYWTARGRRPERPPVLESTLDLALQKAAYEELDVAVEAIVEKYGSPPEWGALCLAEIETGDILAMASYRPEGNARTASFAPLQCLCPPGSVVKPLVFSMALERGVLDWERDTFDCTPNAPRGRWYVPNSRRTIGDEHDCAVLTPREILVQSSNVGAVQVGLRLGREGLQDYLDRFRFGQPTAIGVPAEAPGSLIVEKLGGVMGMPDRTFWVYSGPSLSFGYEYNITPVQLLRAYLTLLSGRERELRLCRGYRRGSERVEAPVIESGERFLSESTLARIRDALVGVVSDETHATARDLHKELVDNGYPPLAGKTGTSEYQEVRDGQLQWIRTASFAGFAPVDEPRFVVVCVLQKPGAAAFWGGRYASPAAGRLLLRALSSSPSGRPSYPQVSADTSVGASTPARRVVGR